MDNDREKKLKKNAYTAAQWTWGLPQTLLGAALYMAHRNDDHFDYNGATATAWDKDTGVSLGKFIFVPRKAAKTAGRSAAKVSESAAGPSGLRADTALLDHEYGHTLQSLILGPFYLLFVGAPSILWNRLPYFQKKRGRTGKSYYSAPFEKTANTLAARHKHRH